MRVQAITEVSTWQQQNPYLTQNAEQIMIGKNVPLVSFEECLRSHMQNSQRPVAARRAGWMATSSMQSYFMIQEASRNSESKLQERAYESLPDL